jgi:uncharacterized membrane protein YfcA
VIPVKEEQAVNDPAFLIAAVIAASCVGLGKGGLPVVAMLSVPILALFISPIAAAGLLLPVYIISDVFGLWAYRREFDRKVLIIMIVAMTLGVGLGWATARVVDEAVVTLVVGLIGASFALNLLLRRGATGPKKEPHWPGGLFWGTIAGFTSFVSHAGGPPYQVWTLPLRLTKAVFVGTQVIAFAYVNALKLIPYAALGQLSFDNLKFAALLSVPASASVFLGVYLVRIVPEALFFKVVTWALLGVSLKLIYDGAFG